MEMFHQIEDGVAVIRAPKGVYRQSKVYRRGSRIYVQYGSGYVRVTAKFGDTWGTSHPDVRVEDIEGEGLITATGEPRWEN
jgi:hypothetical protein